MLHILITAIIFGILASGFKFFVKLRGTLDFSYMAIVIFASYAGTLLNIHRWMWLIFSIIISFVLCIAFTFLILFLSSKLDDVYFTIGTLALYILFYQLAYNLEWITWWALWLSWVTRTLIGSITFTSTNSFLLVAVSIAIIIFLCFFLLKRSYFYKVLTWWWENEIVVKSLGVKINRYKLTMILITTFLAVVWANLFSFYYLYIDPSSFWLGLLVLLIVITFISYKFNDRWTLLVSIIVTLVYEYLRFFKIVDPSKIGYFREMLFGMIVVATAFIVFRKTSFGREN